MEIARFVRLHAASFSQLITRKSVLWPSEVPPVPVSDEDFFTTISVPNTKPELWTHQRDIIMPLLLTNTISFVHLPSAGHGSTWLSMSLMLDLERIDKTTPPEIILVTGTRPKAPNTADQLPTMKWFKAIMTRAGLQTQPINFWCYDEFAISRLVSTKRAGMCFVYIDDFSVGESALLASMIKLWYEGHAEIVRCAAMLLPDESLLDYNLPRVYVKPCVTE